MCTRVSQSGRSGAPGRPCEDSSGESDAGRRLPRASSEPTATTGRASIGRAQFAERFAASARMLWTIAAGVLGDRTGADDVLQEAAMTALTKLDEFDPDTNFVAWMARIVRFIALNHARRGRRQPDAVDPAAMDDTLAGRHAADPREAHMLDDRGQLAGDPARMPFDDRILRALRSVGETARACLLLRTLQDLSYDEIAALLEIPPGTAMSHVHRTRMLLRQSLADMRVRPGTFES